MEIDNKIDSEIDSKIEKLFKILIPENITKDVTINNVTINDVQLISSGIKDLDEKKKNFIIEYIDKFSTIDTEISNDLAQYPDMNNANNFLDKLFRLQRNILLTYIKENTSINCSEPINKILELSNEKFNYSNEILTNYLQNGGNKNNKYYNKYLKYKIKYLSIY